MEKRRVWVFYAVLLALWATGFIASTMRIGHASRQQQAAVAGAPASPPTPQAEARN